MEWYPPIDTNDLQNGSSRTDLNKKSAILESLFENNESYQGLFPVYGDLDPYNKKRAHSRDRKRTWHGGIDLMYGSQTSIYPLSTGKVIVAKDAKSKGHSSNRVIIEHSYQNKKVYSLYTHLNKNSIPQEVKSLAGTSTLINVSQKIGNIGDCGSANLHLHLEVFSKEKIIIPDLICNHNDSNSLRFRISYTKNGTVSSKSWSGTQYPAADEEMVDQDYPSWIDLFTNNKSKFRTWSVFHKSVWTGIESITDIDSSRKCWHYHPLQFVKALNTIPCCFPVTLDAGNKKINKNTTKYIENTEKESKGGFFPIGTNGFWHGGVHVKTPKGSDLHAIKDGKIIAARLQPQTEIDKLRYGSNNFILMQHEHNEKKYYSLYMHLMGLDLVETNEKLKEFFWLTKEKIIETTFAEDVEILSSPKLEKIGKTSSYRDFSLGKGSAKLLKKGDLCETIEEKDGCTKVKLPVERQPEGYVKKSDSYVTISADGKSLTTKVNLTFRTDAKKNKSTVNGLLGKGCEAEVLEEKTVSEGNVWLKIKIKEAYVRSLDSYTENKTETAVDKDKLELIKSPTPAKLDISVNAGDKIWHTGSYGAKSKRQELLHWEIFSEDNLIKESGDNTSTEATSDSEDVYGYPGKSTGWVEGKSICVAGCTGPEFGKVGDTLKYRVNKINWKDAPWEKIEEEVKEFSWKIKYEDGTEKDETKIGPILEFAIPEELRGVSYEVFPYRNSPEDHIKVKTEVAPIEWTHVEDDVNGDYNMDSESIYKLLGKDVLGEDNVLSEDEIISLYKDNPEQKVNKLRNCACKFVSEWAIPNLDKALEGYPMPSGIKAAEVAADFKPYLWWSEAKDAGVELPGNLDVWHYNPIRFLSAIDEPKKAAYVAPPPVYPGITKIKSNVTELNYYTKEKNLELEVEGYTFTPNKTILNEISWKVKVGSEEVFSQENAGENITVPISKIKPLIIDNIDGGVTVNAYFGENEGGFSQSILFTPYLLFNGEELLWINQKEEIQYRWPAVTGLGGFKAKKYGGEKIRGKIPEGCWEVKHSEMQQIPTDVMTHFWGVVFKKGDWPGGFERWGAGRVWLHPLGETKASSDDGYCIHGGEKPGSAGGIDLVGQMPEFFGLFQFTTKMNLKIDGMILLVKYDTASIKINWDLIAKFEGCENKIYVPKDKNGVIEKSGPTIASGFDIGQRDLNELKKMDFPRHIEEKLEKYVDMKGSAAATFVDKNPLTLEDDDIVIINKIVKKEQTKKVKAFYNKDLIPAAKKFEELSKEAQTAFASVFFQYGTECNDFKKELMSNDYEGAIEELLNYTTKTEVKNGKTVMLYLSRRCQEARYLLKAISDEAVKKGSLEDIEKKEKEWAEAYKMKKWW